MCLGQVARVQATGAGTVDVDLSGKRVRVSSMLLDEPVPVGGWVLVYSGFALTALSEPEAAEAVRLRVNGDSS